MYILTEFIENNEIFAQDVFIFVFVFFKVVFYFFNVSFWMMFNFCRIILNK